MKTVLSISALVLSSLVLSDLKPAPVKEIVLQKDENFGAAQLLRSDQDSSVLDFAIIGESLFYTDYLDLGTETSIYLREMALDPERKLAASSIVPDCRPRYLDNAGSVLKFYELENKTLASYDPVAGVVVERRPANYIAESRTFRSGTMISRVSLRGHSYDKVFTEDRIAEMSKRLPVKEFQEFLVERSRRAYELGKYEIVLLDSALDVKKPLLKLYKNEEIVNGVDGRSSLDQSLYPRRIRMSLDRTLAAVFMNHRPGITLFKEDGSIRAEIKSPGSGTKVPEDGPFPGRTILYQSDVVVGEDHLLVADNARLEGDERIFVIWKIGFDSKVFAMARSPYFVTRMVATEGFLYLLGRENQLSRYSYP